MMGARARVTVGVLATFAIMFIAPFPFYGLFSAMGLVEMPDQDSPGRFMLGVVVMKIGVALGFVLIYRLARSSLAGRWLPYAATWWLMYAIVEAGQAVGPGYGAMEAVAGILAEAVYFPLSAFVVDRLLGRPPRAAVP